MYLRADTKKEILRSMSNALAAYEAALWRPVSEHDGGFDPILLELDDGTCGEARWYEDEHDWYWAGTTPDSYHAGPVIDINIAKPRRFRPLPIAPEVKQMDDLSALIERVRRLEGPDREVDAEICRLLEFPVADGAIDPSRKDDVAPFTASLDAVVDLIERELPGWAWKVGTCCVSDDAWLVPDFNSPVHGERLKRELPFDTLKAGDLWDIGIDIDQRPSGRPAIALLLAALTAIKEKRND